MRSIVDEHKKKTPEEKKGQSLALIDANKLVDAANFDTHYEKL